MYNVSLLPLSLACVCDHTMIYVPLTAYSVIAGSIQMCYVIVTARSLLWTLLTVVATVAVLSAILTPKWLIGPPRLKPSGRSLIMNTKCKLQWLNCWFYFIIYICHKLKFVHRVAVVSRSILGPFEKDLIYSEIWGSHGNSMKINVFWDETPYGLVDVYRLYWLIYRVEDMHPEDGEIMFLRNVTKHLLDCMVSHPKIQQFSAHVYDSDHHILQNLSSLQWHVCDLYTLKLRTLS